MRVELLSSEGVGEGHPDKVADQISDTVLDVLIAKDPNARVACETLVTTGLCVIAGEITTKSWVNFTEIARTVIQDIGYTDDDYGINGASCAVLASVDAQSPDIARGVDSNTKKAQGAGDQGMMFGYACNETAEYMPLPILLARNLVNELARTRQTGEIHFLRPDGKSQVTVEYEGEKPIRVEAVVVSTQHTPEVDHDTIQAEVIEKVVRRVIPANLLDGETKYYVNPTGRFVVGGPRGDTGLTGRKIIADTYGGWARHGGGAFSGKDPSKVDRSAAYMCRYVAKNVVAAGLADRCEVQVSYAIGVAEPISVRIDTFGSGKVPEAKIAKIVRKVFNLKPKGIIQCLNLRRPIYKETARYGHFGRNHPGYTWEKTDMVAALRAEAGI